MALSVADIKLYLRIDTDVEDAMLQRLLEQADAYLAGAVDDFALHCKAKSFDKQADIVRAAIVAEMYNNRDCQEEKHQAFPYFIRSAIAQLQYSADSVSAEGSGGA